jgi:hypothetical protein
MDAKHVENITVCIGVQNIEVDITRYENDYYDVTKVRHHYGRKKQWNDFIAMRGTITTYCNIEKTHGVDAYQVIGIKKSKKIYVHETFLKYFLKSYNINMFNVKTLKIFNYKIKIIDDKKLLIDSNNFINVSQFCKDHNKPITKFLNKLKIILPEYIKDTDINNDLEYIIQDPVDKNYWLHYSLIAELLIYISPIYYIKASKLLYASFNDM